MITTFRISWIHYATGRYGNVRYGNVRYWAGTVRYGTVQCIQVPHGTVRYRIAIVVFTDAHIFNLRTSILRIKIRMLYVTFLIWRERIGLRHPLRPQKCAPFAFFRVWKESRAPAGHMLSKSHCASRSRAASVFQSCGCLKLLFTLKERKKSLIWGHLKDIGSTVGIQSYP